MPLFLLHLIESDSPSGSWKEEKNVFYFLFYFLLLTVLQMSPTFSHFASLHAPCPYPGLPHTIVFSV